ncbi:MAG: hypothetical protein ACFFDP_00160, partial [Promethearchaeota archaeon]
MSHEDYQVEVNILAQQLGTPRRVNFNVEMMLEEFKLVQHTVAQGRHHDVTIFIRHRGKYAVI